MIVDEIKARIAAGKGGDGVISGNQLVLSRDEILETMRVFLADLEYTTG